MILKLLLNIQWYEWYLKNIDECNRNKTRKMLIAFDDMLAGMLSNKNLNPVVTELFIRVRVLNTYLVFITKSYSAVP